MTSNNNNVLASVDDLIAVLSTGSKSPAFIAATLGEDTDEIKTMLDARPDLFRSDDNRWALVTPVAPMHDYRPSYVRFFDEYEQSTDPIEPLSNEDDS